jgi:hypothetical protein
MKNITRYVRNSLFALVLSLGASNFASANDAKMSFAEEEAFFPQTCQAFTQCWHGGVIACRTFGWGCTWFTIPGQSVQCTGYDGWGRYVNFYYRCF